MKQKHVTAIPQTNDPKTRDRFYRKNTEFFRLVEQIKLWPTRSGVLHGVKSIEIYGETARITTFCGASFLVRNSKNSRAARWLRPAFCVLSLLLATACLVDRSYSPFEYFQF